VLASSFALVPNYKLLLNAGGEAFLLAQSLNPEFGIGLCRVTWISTRMDGWISPSMDLPGRPSPGFWERWRVGKIGARSFLTENG
jgi:hypothetical protein